MSVQSESCRHVDMGFPAKMDSQLTCYYPIHDSVKNQLHKDYVDFYNKYLISAQQAHLLPISITRGRKGNFGGSDPLPVGSIHDLKITRRETHGPDIPVRCFIPDGHPPASGWPVMLYLHGGGWVLGDIDSENNVCTHMCVRSRCVVITVEYRLAPEDPFPAAIHDAWESLLWIGREGANILNLDTSRIAVGGASAGANLAAVIVNKSAKSIKSQIKIVSQLLVVPALDNTALPCNNPTYNRFEHTASLSAEKMLWYRNLYLPNQADRDEPDASPLFFVTSQKESRTISKLPPTLIIVGGCDILRHEGEVYGRMLKDHNVPTQVHVMQGMPHPFLALDAVLEAGRTAITLLCDELARAYST